ncbi:tyrosine-type recombinase/integrase [Streptococcus halotolerans]|uniref:tyrosine-type recombinase/integrase n=1 Tax=Streptococcus halotolerans TaxID=1814128 RepID=UPI000786DD7E|nr:site-specific integrase [Streptococcus halotolerans]QBX08359.1 integrase/recombinase [Streptococcus satellite phage Javan251]
MKIREYKTKSGATAYRATVYLGIDVLTGKTVTTSISARTKREIKAKEKAKLKEWLESGCTKKKKNSVKTFNELVESWKLSVYPSYKYHTKVTFDNQLKYYILPAYGDIKLEKLTRFSIQETVNTWADNYNNNKGKPYKLYDSLFNLIHTILGYGVSVGFLENNPANDIIVPKRKKDKPKRKHFEPNEVKTFIVYLDQLDDTDFRTLTNKVLFSLLLASGCRIGEALALEWSDVDFDNKTISISKTLQHNLKTAPTKTKAGTRIITLDNDTMRLLNNYQKHQRLNGIMTGIVFSSRRGYKTSSSFGHYLKKYLADCGLPVLGFHAFRHTHASLMMNADMQPKELQYRLGHSNIATTLDIYSHLSKEKEKESATIFQNALNSL